MKWHLLALVLLFASPILADDLPALYDVSSITENRALNIEEGVLNIYETPSHDAVIIGTIAAGEKRIEVIRATDDHRWGW